MPRFPSKATGQGDFASLVSPWAWRNSAQLGPSELPASRLPGQKSCHRLDLLVVQAGFRENHCFHTDVMMMRAVYGETEALIPPPPVTHLLRDYQRFQHSLASPGTACCLPAPVAIVIVPVSF